MKRTTINGIEFIVSRQRPGKPTELVSTTTGDLVLHPGPLTTPVIIHELPTIPKLLPFSQRGGLEFVLRLQAKRLEAFKENLKTRKTHKGPGDRKPSVGKGGRGKSRVSSISQAIQEELKAGLKTVDPKTASKLEAILKKKGML